MKKPISYSGLQKFEAFDRAAITGEVFLVLTEVDKFEEVRKGLEESNVDFENAEISMIPSNSVKVEGKPAEHMLKMLDLLDDFEEWLKEWGLFKD